MRNSVQKYWKFSRKGFKIHPAALELSNNKYIRLADPDIFMNADLFNLSFSIKIPASDKINL